MVRNTSLSQGGVESVGRKKKQPRRAQNSKGKFKGFGFFAVGVQKRGVCACACVSVQLSSFFQLRFSY